MTRVIAHRGARSMAPENTLLAARIACELGADSWETDVTLSRDVHPVLFHDETLVRCTDAVTRFPDRASYRVRDFTLKELLTLDAGSYFEKTDPFSQIRENRVERKLLKEFKTATIPTLEAALAFTRDKNWKVNLELKCHDPQGADNDLPDRTLSALRAAEFKFSRVVISSFYHPWLDRIREKEPGIGTAALLGDDDDAVLEFEDFRFETYNINSLLVTPVLIADLKARQKKVNLFTINDPATFRHFERLGVDGIFTDFPQRFVKKT